MQNKRIIIVGKGGSGKDYLKEKFVEKGFNPSVSFTTRKPRVGEIEGIDYYYCSSEKFSSMIKNQELYEYKEFRGWFYGTSLKEFNSAEIFIMTPPAILELAKKDRKNSFIIYLDIDERIREIRLSNRNDADSVDRRLKADKEMFENFNDYDLRISKPDF
jgi:guanylate kinase